MPKIKTTKFLSGWYRLSNGVCFSNVKLETRGEFVGKWSADIRRANGDLVQYAGIWNTKREAVAEATRYLTSNQYS